MTVLGETFFIVYQYFINERRFRVANKRSKTNYPIVMEGGVGGCHLQVGTFVYCSI